MRVYMQINLYVVVALLVSVAIMPVPQTQGCQVKSMSNAKAKQFQTGKINVGDGGRENQVSKSQNRKTSTDKRKTSTRTDNDKIDSATIAGKDDKVYIQENSGNYSTINSMIHIGSGDINVYIENPRMENGKRNREPTELEMREALAQAMKSRGAVQKDQNTFVAERSWFSLSVGLEIIEFEKLECQSTNDGPGYVCYYKIVSRLVIYSNDSTREGYQLAEDYKKLITLFMGGNDTFSDIGKLRFLRSKSGWMVTNK